MKREVFYISGYDPRGARFYYGLYKEHLLKQNALNHLGATVSSRKVLDGKSSWEVLASDDGESVSTKYNFLSWTDIIGNNWSRSILDMTKNFIFSVKEYIFTGLIFKFAKIAPKQMIAGLFPAVYLLMLSSLSFVSIYIIEFPFSLIIVYVIWKFGISFGKKIAVFWLFNIFTLSAKWANGLLPELDTKVEDFAQTIFTSLEEKDIKKIDEILLVGHSVGAMISVAVAARVIHLCKKADVDIDKFKLLTLGGTIPLMGLQTNARRYREDLQTLADAEKFVWVDYSSHIDGTCFPLVDPILSAGLTKTKENNPIILSAKFFKLFTTKTYKKIRHRWFNVHFLYLMSSERAGEYDYFKLTAGAKPLTGKI